MDLDRFKVRVLGEMQGLDDTFNGVALEGSVDAIRRVGAFFLEEVVILPAALAEELLAYKRAPKKRAPPP